MSQHTVALTAVAMLVGLHGPAPATCAADLKAAADRRPAASSELTARDGVRLRGRWFEMPVRRAVEGAAELLAHPACAAVLDDFRDGSGRPLRARLAALEVDPATYARMVLFYDGSSEAPCRRPRVNAFTVPGSRIVHACPALGSLVASQPAEAEAVVVHEILHTLGLEENPPSGEEISAAVSRRCGPVRAALVASGADRARLARE